MSAIGSLADRPLLATASSNGRKWWKADVAAAAQFVDTFAVTLRTPPLLIFLLWICGCAPVTYGSGECSNNLPGWRGPGDIGHEVPAFFITLGGKNTVTERFWADEDIKPRQVIDRNRLSEVLDDASQMFPSPMVILQPSPSADCNFVQAVRKEMNMKLACAGGQCGEGNGWREFEGMPPAD